ncbi:hypothetical protein ACQPXS_07455 [Streptomyces sp. CA-142005]|uniref:hypothetical protein n=1 Tax=Streptomyces sp. CA-142005 TaxID=3240052 RepID=UPI003D9264CB
MHTSPLLVRCGLTLAAAAALPAALAVPSAAASGISVSTTGSAVSVVTGACSEINGTWGNAALLTSRQANFSQGRQSALSGTTVSQSAAWTGVRPGTYTVVASGSGSGSEPTTSSTASPAPSRGVLGGLGGAARDYGTLTLGIGAALVSTGAVVTGWYLRRRSKPHRL